MVELPFLVDQAAEKLRSLLDPAMLVKGDKFVRSTVQPILDKIIRDRFSKRVIILEPKDSATVFHEAIGEVTAELRRWADGYTPMRWLWMLRRLPILVFEGRLASTRGYDTILAEVISGRSTCTRAETPQHVGGQVAYSLDGAVVQRLARFCAGVRFLSHLHQSYRWAGKGAQYVVEPGKLPHRIADPDLSSAVKAYDVRVLSSSYPLSRMGSVVTMPDQLNRTDELLWVTGIDPTECKVPLPGVDFLTAGEKEWGRTDANFAPKLLDLNRLRRLVRDNGADLAAIFTKPIAALIYLLTSALLLITRHNSGFLSVLKTGYLAWTFEERVRADLTDAFGIRPGLVREIMEAAQLNSADDAIFALDTITGNECPLVAGPVIRRSGGTVCLDLYAASNALDSELEFPAIQGRLANSRAAHFEDVVQAVVDLSNWKPSDNLRALRRKTLKQDGEDLTDFDAIGERGARLLLVSCKSTVYSRLYDAGDYRAVRNAATLVRDAIGRWQAVLSRLRQRPKGSNFDLSGYSELIGVVCTPNVVFVDAETLNQAAVDGLRSYVSVAELADWLGVHDPFGLNP